MKKKHKTNLNGDCLNCGMLSVAGDGQECPALDKKPVDRFTSKRFSVSPISDGYEIYDRQQNRVVAFADSLIEADSMISKREKKGL